MKACSSVAADALRQFPISGVNVRVMESGIKLAYAPTEIPLMLFVT